MNSVLRGPQRHVKPGLTSARCCASMKVYRATYFAHGPRALVATLSAAQDTVEKYLSGPVRRQAGGVCRTAGRVRSLLANQHWEDAASAIQRALQPDNDFTTFQSLYRVYAKLKPHLLATADEEKGTVPFLLTQKSGRSPKLAILGGFTTTQLAQAIELALFSMGGQVEVVEADYGVYRQEILDADSALYRFGPTVVFLATSWRELIHRPAIGQDRAEVAALVEAEFADWSLLWRTAHDRLDCLVVQNSFDRPAWRQMDNHEMRHPASLWRFIGRVNDRMADCVPPYVVLHDVDGLASLAGPPRLGRRAIFLPCQDALRAGVHRRLRL